MTFSVREIALLFISFQSLMFAVILISNKGPKRLSNILLASVLFALGSQMALLFVDLDFEIVVPYLCLFGFAYGPLLYLYTKSLIYQNFNLTKRDALHALPFFIMLFTALIGYGLCAKFGSILYISLLAYTSVSIRDIIKYREVVRSTRSTIFQMNLSWLQWTLILFTVTFLIDIYQHFYQDIEVIPGLSLVNLSLLILVNGMFYKGMKQPMIFQGISIDDETMILSRTDTEMESVVRSEELDRIKKYMTSKEPFKNADLTLNQLADQLEIPARRLSTLINKKFNQNFMDFINTYRIDLAKTRLANPNDPKETILEIMYEVGFNSKSSFNTLFKQKTGNTPTDFKRKSL